MGGNVLIILDEIDNIPADARNDFLYELPRAEANENTPITDAKVGLIGISNDLKFVDVLEPKVKSTLGEREIKFGPYDATELRDILATTPTLRSERTCSAKMSSRWRRPSRRRNGATFGRDSESSKRPESTRGWRARMV